MSGNCISSCANIDHAGTPQSTTPGPTPAPLAGADRRSTTAAHSRTGSLYSLLLEQEIDAFWLLKIHTGSFGPINVQPIYSVILGVLTVVVTVSGLVLLIRTPER